MAAASMVRDAVTGAARNPLQGVTTALPVALPGCSFPELNQPVSYRKRQLLRTGQEAGTAPVARGELGGREFARITTERIMRAKPDWTTLDRKALRFYGYFREGVHESGVEAQRVRKVIILFHLEDGTVQVSEPRQDNSGIPQGALIKRLRIVKAGTTSDYFAVDDFKVGETVVLYGKAIQLVDCDAFTRQFFDDLGVECAEPLPYPDDTHSHWRTKKEQRGTKDAELSRVMNLDASQRTGGVVQKLSRADLEMTKSFFQNDRKVLRYFCVWQDKSVYGEPRLFTLLYYLADKTCCVTEINPPNSGREPFPTFIKRQRITKCRAPVQEKSLETISEARGACAEHYTDADFMIGRAPVVFGREMLIFDMDEATKKYYAAVHGVTDFSPLDITATAGQGSKRPPRQSEPPAHNGFGSEEDSLGSWLHLVLKPPKRDVERELKHSHDVLRFGAVLDNDQPTNFGRRFIVCYYIADDTVSVFEQNQRNSGIVAGKYLARQKVKTSKPGEPSVFISSRDMFVGNVVSIAGQKLRLVETDQRTVNFMEGKPKEFSVADINCVVAKIRDVLLKRHTKVTDVFRHFDKDHSGTITLEEFRQVMRELNMPVTDHELVTLMRYFDTDGDGVISYHEFVDRMVPKDDAGELDASKGITAATELETDTRKYTNAHQQVDKKRFADRVYAMFKERMWTRRVMMQDAFRQLGNASSDGRIGEREFQQCVTDTLQLSLSPKEIEALTWKFFYDELRRAAQRGVAVPGSAGKQEAVAADSS
eukprot:TRINITY_DN13203_c0_g1_i2.p1 TRINITY_DN13203_c0_g1~~TRINITY_DN13203_c0_g1_i2.p1  ORF type:complete len:765 (+),score=312.89 TRINITY_DN13203_c0_g1_i2:57-2351(+)